MAEDDVMTQKPSDVAGAPTTGHMDAHNSGVEVMASGRPRRHWTAEQKRQILAEMIGRRVKFPNSRDRLGLLAKPRHRLFRVQAIGTRFKDCVNQQAEFRYSQECVTRTRRDCWWPFDYWRMLRTRSFFVGPFGNGHGLPLGLPPGCAKSLSPRHAKSKNCKAP